MSKLATALEPVLRWEDLVPERQFPSVSLTLDDSLIDAYLKISGESDPAFDPPGDLVVQDQTRGLAPVMCTVFVSYAKSALGGRWPTGTLQLTQEVQSYRALRRGETVRLDLQVTTRNGKEGRQLFRLSTTMHDAQGVLIGEQGAELLWWRDAEFQRVAAVQNSVPERPIANQPGLIGPLNDRFSLERLQRYGELAGARDPIHVDPEFARTTPTGINIAQGKLVMALPVRLMHQHLGQAWLDRGGVNVRLRRPVKADEPIEAWARPLENGRFEVWCQRADGERVLEGEAGLAPEPAHE